MCKSLPRNFIFTALLLFFLSLSAIIINFFTENYPGNDYFPPNVLGLGLVLLFIYGGLLIQFDSKSPPIKQMHSVMVFYLIMCSIAFATNAVQYTPFRTIDQSIINIEQSLHIDIQAILSWTNQHPMLLRVLAFTYDSLPYQMTYIPLLIILAKRYNELQEYYFLLLLSTIIGFTFYYFFPTTAPASLLESPYFMPSQLATGLKYLQIHDHIQPTTIDGGMIALPSFHMIWAWFSLYLLRVWPILWAILLPVNLLLVSSCVLLGWHYPMDILGGLIVIVLSHMIYHQLNRSAYSTTRTGVPIAT